VDYLSLESCLNTVVPRFATFKGGDAKFFFLFLSFYTYQFVGRVFGDTHCFWEQWGVTLFLHVISKNLITHSFNHFKPFSTRFLELLLKFEPVGESNKLIFLSPFLLLRHPLAARSWKGSICQVFLH
jgi:hypothetical protein